MIIADKSNLRKISRCKQLIAQLVVFYFFVINEKEIEIAFKLIHKIHAIQTTQRRYTSPAAA